jgi:transposase-like protein
MKASALEMQEGNLHVGANLCWPPFPAKVILWAVRWHCRYPLAYRNVEEMLKERGVSVDRTTETRWVQV